MKKENEYEKETWLVIFNSFCLGVFLYMFVDMLKAGAEFHGIMLDVKILIPWISAICLLLGFVGIVLTFNFLKKSRKFHSLYQEEMDDDLNETYYVQMYRNLEFGTIAFNSASVAILLALFISGSEVIVLDISHITLSLSFLGLVLVFNAQNYLFKTIAIVRQIGLVFFSTPKDILEHFDSYDEGERKANLEQSFRILFQLNNYVLPGLYFLIALFSLLTGEIQLLAFLLVGAIHVYINVMQLPMVKRYFK